MKFSYNQFSCDVDVFFNVDDIVMRFYDASKEQDEDQIVNLVIVDSGFGFLCLKVKGTCGLLSGFLDKAIFTSNEMALAAIELLVDFSGITDHLPYHVDLVKIINYEEYNGEY